MGLNSNRASKSGFTLVELVIAITIAALILTMGVPSFRNFFDLQRLKGAGEQVYAHIQRARSEAITRNTDVAVNFSSNGTTTWSYGISTLNNCDLAVTDATAATACTLVIDDGDGNVHSINGVVDTDDKVLMRFSDDDHREIKMARSNFLSGTQITFSGFNGTAVGNTGDILLESAEENKLLVKVAALGQVRICSPDGSVSGYVDTLPGNDADC